MNKNENNGNNKHDNRSPIVTDCAKKKKIKTFINKSIIKRTTLLLCIYSTLQDVQCNMLSTSATKCILRKQQKWDQKTKRDFLIDINI